MVALACACGDDASPADGGASDGASCPLSCDDGVFCNGVEVCAEGSCAPGAAPSCDDGDPCTVDSCSDSEQICLHDPPDEDRDGHFDVACGGDDCDDRDRTRYPGNVEVCDVEGTDEDCDSATFGVRDGDGDGSPDARCCNEGEAGLVCGRDCDDASGSIHPTSTEACNELDDDCDGSVDERVLETFYVDADGDGFASMEPSAESTEACAPPAGFASHATDCDDGNGARHPAATEDCNRVDDNCNGAIDDGVRCDCTIGMSESCGPPATVGICRRATRSCIAGLWGACEGAVWPTTEACNGLDDDCDGTTDEGTLTSYYPDCDGDMFGDAGAAAVRACSPPLCGTRRHVTDHADCDDTNLSIRPGAPERCSPHGVDENCGGGAYDTLACAPGTTGSCPVACQPPGTQRCTDECAYEATCTPRTTSWSWSAADGVWAHGCGGTPGGGVWCAATDFTCHMTFGNYRTDLPPGRYEATWTFGVVFYPDQLLTLEGRVLWPGPPTTTIASVSDNFRDEGGTLRMLRTEFTIASTHACNPVEFLFVKQAGSPTACLHRLDLRYLGP